MNVGLIIGKHNSRGVVGKNYRKVLGRPLVEYPMLAATNSSLVDRLYVSTDSEIIQEIASRYDARIIERPASLALSNSATEDVYKHAYEIIKKEVEHIEYIFLMFANCPDILPEYWEEAVKILDANPDFDSVISISKYNMFAPLRARQIHSDGSTSPMQDLDSLGLQGTFDRDAMGDCYFADFAVQVVRPHCLEETSEAALPFLWLGKKQGYLIKEFGFDVDAAWQIPVVEYSLRELGFTESNTPYSKKFTTNENT